MNVGKPAIAKVSLRNDNFRNAGGYAKIQAAGLPGHINTGAGERTFVSQRAEESINTPQTGGVGRQNGAPFGGFQNTGGYIGESGIPQTGGGQIANAGGGAGAPSSPQKTTGTSTNPYSKSSQPTKSANDALTKALVDKMIQDRAKAQAVTRNPQTKKISEVDRSKVEFDEKTKVEIDKLAQAFKADGVEMKKSIESFQENFEKQLAETNAREVSEKVPEQKQLNTILDDLVKYSQNDKWEEGKAVGNEVGSDKYNPQNFMDAAERLDNWLGEDNNATEAKEKGYFEDLSKINEQAQKMKGTAEEEIAYYENNPKTVLNTSEVSATNAAEEAQRLEQSIDSSSAELSEEDQSKVDSFKTKLGTSMESINPKEGESFDIEASNTNLSELKKSFNELPEALTNNPEIQGSFKEVADLGKMSIEGQELARKMEPETETYNQEVRDYVQGADKLDAAWTEHRTPEERETDIRESVDDNAFVDTVVKEEAQRLEETDSNQDSGSAIQPETSSPEAQRQDNLELAFGEDEFDAIDAVGQESEAPRSLDQTLDLDIEDSVSDISSKIDSETIDIEEINSEIEEPEIEIEEIEIEDLTEEIDELIEEY